MSEVAAEKKALRSLMQATLRSFASSELEIRGGEVARHIAAMEEWIGAHTILCYLGMPKELPTSQLIATARRDGKAVAVPRIEGDEIDFLMLPLETTTLPRDRWNIPVPDPEWPPFDPKKAGKILVATPGIAFDLEGYRLGRGKGFYDRFLSRLRIEAPGFIALGLCLSEQIVPQVPRDIYDQVMDGLVTDRGSTIFASGRN